MRRGRRQNWPGGFNLKHSQDRERVETVLFYGRGEEKPTWPEA